MLLDTRSPESFASGHLRGSINVGLDGRFAEYAGDIVRPGQQVVLLGDTGRAPKPRSASPASASTPSPARSPTSRPSWPRGPNSPRPPAACPPPTSRAWLADDPDVQVVDVRNPGETKVGGTIPGARNVPLPQLLDHLDDLDRDRPTIVYCAGGYRSSVAASTLPAHGFTDVADLIGGYPAWADGGEPVESGRGLPA